MPEMIRIENESGHNYSTQTLNSTEKAKEKLRQTLKKVHTMHDCNLRTFYILC